MDAFLPPTCKEGEERGQIHIHTLMSRILPVDVREVCGAEMASLSVMLSPKSWSFIVACITSNAGRGGGIAALQNHPVQAGEGGAAVQNQAAADLLHVCLMRTETTRCHTDGIMWPR